MSIGQKLWGVLVSPGEAFKAIGEDPKVLIPALLFIGLNLLMVLLILPETKEILLSTYKSVELPAGTDINKLVSQGTIMAIVASAVAPPLMWLIEAALLALFNAFSVGQAKFKQLFAVAVYAYVPAMIGAVIQTGLVKAMGADAISKIKLSMALVLPPDMSSGFLYNFLNMMNIFTIWGLILLIIGGAIVMAKDSKKVAVYLGGLWLVYTGIMAYVATLAPKSAGM